MHSTISSLVHETRTIGAGRHLTGLTGYYYHYKSTILRLLSTWLAAPFLRQFLTVKVDLLAGSSPNDYETLLQGLMNEGKVLF